MGSKLMGLFDSVLDNVGKAYSGGKGFEYGTHEVIIGTAEAKKDNKDRAIIEIVVFDEKDNEKKATCTLWFHSEGGAKMAVTKVLGLLVHKVGEEKKDKVRELGKQLFASITDTTKARDVATKLINDKLLGEKAYLVAEPNGKYPTTMYGDIWHYPAEPQSDKEEDDSIDVSQAPGVEATEIPNFESDDL